MSLLDKKLQELNVWWWGKDLPREKKLEDFITLYGDYYQLNELGQVESRAGDSGLVGLADEFVQACKELADIRGATTPKEIADSLQWKPTPTLQEKYDAVLKENVDLKNNRIDLGKRLN